MRTRTLLTQVLAVNAILVALTALVSAVFASARLQDLADGQGVATLIAAVLAVILLTSVLLRPRLEPLERLVRTMEQVDLANPDVRAQGNGHAAKEIQRLTAGFNTMLERLQEE